MLFKRLHTKSRFPSSTSLISNANITNDEAEIKVLTFDMNASCFILGQRQPHSKSKVHTKRRNDPLFSPECHQWVHFKQDDQLLTQYLTHRKSTLLPNS